MHTPKARRTLCAAVQHSLADDDAQRCAWCHRELAQRGHQPLVAHGCHLVQVRDGGAVLRARTSTEQRAAAATQRDAVCDADASTAAAPRPPATTPAQHRTSPPTATPCTARSTAMSAGAATPIIAYVGRQPISSVGSVTPSTLHSRLTRRPCASPTCLRVQHMVCKGQQVLRPGSAHTHARSGCCVSCCRPRLCADATASTLTQRAGRLRVV
jgi:hypothetical protein